MKTKLCKTCRRTLPLDSEHFYQDRSKSTGFYSKCKQCAQAYAHTPERRVRQKAYDQTPKRKEQHRIYDKKPHRRARHLACNLTPKAKARRYAYCRTAEFKERQKRKYREQRYEVLAHYSNGTVECACCGENIIEFLAIDHLNGGGGKHIKALIQTKQSPTMFRWLRKQGYPTGYQILCHNCNMAKGFYGQCPHKTLLFKEKNN